MAHLTNFSFEVFHEMFTEDASLLFLYHGAKKSKETKNSNQGGPCLKIVSFPTLKWALNHVNVLGFKIFSLYTKMIGSHYFPQVQSLAPAQLSVMGEWLLSPAFRSFCSSFSSSFWSFSFSNGEEEKLTKPTNQVRRSKVKVQCMIIISQYGQSSCQSKLKK